MNTRYQRVIPRDLFNEAKLLKCMGRLTLLIHDQMAPESLAFEENGQPFKVALLDEGSLVIANLPITINRKQVTFKTTYNSKGHWPLLVEYNYCEYYVFNQDGTFTPEFIDFCESI